MTISVKHTFQSAKPDGTDATLIQPSNWNEEHTLTLATNKILGRITAGTGAVEEIGPGTGLGLSGGNLNITTVPVANGGTGLTSPGAAGNVLTSDGSVWISQPAGSTSYPQNVQSSNYTLVLTDSGKQIYSANTAAQTITIPTNASVAFPIGTIIAVVNMGTNGIGISGAGVTIYPNGSATALTTATVAPGQNIQLVKTATNAWNCTYGSLTNIPYSYLIVAGGGAGAGGTYGGGGGGGGMLTGTSTAPSGTLTITVGAGGAASSAQGNNSSISGVATAVGGGGGGATDGLYINGGSGGGRNQTYGGGTFRGGLGIYGQGNNGGGSNTSYYAAGGGGGAGAAGANAVGYGGANGGDGLASSITGSSVTYAGGGGGGTSTSGAGAGGAGGGGAAGNNASNGTSGTANTGGGGGGTGDYITYPNPGAGGSGVVVISSPVAAASTTGSPTVTTSGGLTIYKFTSSGTITW